MYAKFKLIGWFATGPPRAKFQILDSFVGHQSARSMPRAFFAQDSALRSGTL